MDQRGACFELEQLLNALKPQGRELVSTRPGLVDDECRWFMAALRAELIQFRECVRGCPRLRRCHVPGYDEFATPSGQLRHMYSAPGSQGLRLNREYVPHIASYGYAILQGRYRGDHSSFSRYRSFSRDLLSKREGDGYETDAEFYGSDGQILLHIEVKAKPVQVDRIVAQLDRTEELRRLPDFALKELEYVLDLAPRYLWVVGPGSVDPPTHVFHVTVDGQDARFERVGGLPGPED